MRRLLTVTVFLFITICSFAQQDSAALKPDSIKPIRTDSVARERMEKSASLATQRLRERYAEQLALSRQSQLLANLRAVFQRTRDFLKRGVDTSGMERDLDKTERKIEVAGEGIFINQGTIQTARNVSTSATLLSELAIGNEIRQREIDRYLKDLEEFRSSIDSLASDSLLFYLPSDTAEVREFVNRMRLFQREIRGTDSLLNLYIRKTRALDTRADILQGNILSRLEDIESFHQSLSRSTFSRELVYIWQKPENTRPFGEILNFSFRKAYLVFTFYMANHAEKIFLLLLIIFLLSSFLRNLRHSILHAMGRHEEINSSLILKHPWATAALITIAIGQFIFPNPPFSFYVFVWTTASVCLSVIIWNYISPVWRRFFVLTLIQYAFACFLNFILQPSFLERMFMIALGLCGVIMSWRFLLSGERKELKEKRLVIFLWLFTAMVSTSIFTNIVGQYNLSKALLTSGYFNLIVGLLLLWTIRLLHGIFRLSAEAYSESGKRKFHLDFSRMETEVPPILYYILGIGWFILIGRNFYIYKQVTDPFVNFFEEVRTIGNFEFSFGSVVLFISILLLATLMSKLVSYFADGTISAEGTRKNKLGTWMLLIRITIITTGIFLAFAAAGISMDKVAIVFGALSVGIGFGLQNLVSSLVSGVIIAFEKPLNVGDIVEVGGRSGTMKSIGFRSSVISTFEGSDVVIPNGDLLNQHLVNWTLNTTARRVEILVGVNYNTDLEQTVQLIRDLINSDHRILKFPDAMVLVNNFNTSSIDLRILVWVDNRDNWPQVRSDLMLAIKKAFNENKIEIPYPQMVLHNGLPTDNDKDGKE